MIQCPVTLLIGDMQQLRAYVRDYLDARLSAVTYDDAGYGYHANLTWIPMVGRSQRREDIQRLFTATAYDRSYDDPAYIVVEHVDCLTHAAANSMLKLLEEPPPGYYIILLAASEDAVLSTVRSRCYIQRHISTCSYQHHPLYRCITNVHDVDIHDINAALEAHVPTEQETRIVLEGAQTFWLQQYRSSLYHGKRHRIRCAQAILDILRNAIHNAPTSGNVKLFWRVLFSQIWEYGI